MLGNLWMPGIALIVGTRPLPRAGKAPAPRPSRLLPLRKPRPLRLLSQGTGMWGMRGGGDLPGGGKKSEKAASLATEGNWLWLCVCLSPSRKGTQKGLKDSLRSQPRAGVVPGASRCPVLPPSSCEGVRRTELGPNCILQHRSQAW